MGAEIRIETADDITLEVLEAVAWNRQRLVIAPWILHQVRANHSSMLSALEGGQKAYGVTTGMGYLAGIELTEAEQREHQANLLLGRAVGGPPYLSREEARALMTARLAGFLRARSGVTPELCAYLADRLADDFVPAVPRNEIGCAGEIIPLAHAFQTLLGTGWVIERDGDLRPASRALAERGVAPYRPGLKEGIALIAGAPGAIAVATACHRSAEVLFDQAIVCSAAAIDAIRAPLGAYDLRIAELANDPLMASILARIAILLDGSSDMRQTSQAPVSFRVVPQVLSALSRALIRLEEDIRRELRAVTDSPAFVDGQFLTSGGFHAVGLAVDLDTLAIALTHAFEIAGQQTHRLLDGRFSGLPDQLSPRPGSQAGLIVVHKRSIGAIHEMRRLCAPSTIGVADSSLGQEDAQHFAFEAAARVNGIIDLGRDVLAGLLLVCRQAWALRGDGMAAGLGKTTSTIEAFVPNIDRDRPLGGDIDELAVFLQMGGLRGDGGH